MRDAEQRLHFFESLYVIRISYIVSPQGMIGIFKSYGQVHSNIVQLSLLYRIQLSGIFLSCMNLIACTQLIASAYGHSAVLQNTAVDLYKSDNALVCLDALHVLDRLGMLSST